jgi:hypothetical protein
MLRMAGLDPSVLPDPGYILTTSDDNPKTGSLAVINPGSSGLVILVGDMRGDDSVRYKWRWCRSDW